MENFPDHSGDFTFQFFTQRTHILEFQIVIVSRVFYVSSPFVQLYYQKFSFVLYI